MCEYVYLAPIYTYLLGSHLSMCLSASGMRLSVRAVFVRASMYSILARTQVTDPHLKTWRNLQVLAVTYAPTASGLVQTLVCDPTPTTKWTWEVCVIALYFSVYCATVSIKVAVRSVDGTV